MAFNLGELLDNMELDLPDSAAQPTVTPQKKGFNLVTSITAYLIGVSEEKFSEKEDALAYDASVFARLDKEEKAKIIRRYISGIGKSICPSCICQSMCRRMTSSIWIRE